MVSKLCRTLLVRWLLAGKRKTKNNNDKNMEVESGRLKYSFGILFVYKLISLSFWEIFSGPQKFEWVKSRSVCIPFTSIALKVTWSLENLSS